MQNEMNQLFAEGGVMQQGGTVDPVSGNDVPPGAMAKEVRDDIDAKLSEGEFVIPADVVRYIGLETLMKLRDKAKAGLQKMAEIGQMGNAEEVPDAEALHGDDDDSFSSEIDSIMSEEEGGEDRNYAEGGYVVPENRQLYRDAPIKGFEMVPMTNDAGQTIYIPFINGVAQLSVPAGYKVKTPNAEQAPAPTAPVDTTAPTQGGDSGGGGGGGDSGTTGGSTTGGSTGFSIGEDGFAVADTVSPTVGSVVGAVVGMALGISPTAMSSIGKSAITQSNFANDQAAMSFNVAVADTTAPANNEGVTTAAATTGPTGTGGAAASAAASAAAAAAANGMSADAQGAASQAAADAAVSGASAAAAAAAGAAAANAADNGAAAEGGNTAAAAANAAAAADAAAADAAAAAAANDAANVAANDAANAAAANAAATAAADADAAAAAAGAAAANAADNGAAAEGGNTAAAAANAAAAADAAAAAAASGVGSGAAASDGSGTAAGAGTGGTAAGDSGDGGTGAASSATGGGGGGGGGGCFLTTAAVNHMGHTDNGQLLNTLRDFRDNYMRKNKEASKDVAWYYENAPKIVKALDTHPDAKKIYRKMYNRFIMPSYLAIKMGKDEVAYGLYKKGINFARQEAGIKNEDIEPRYGKHGTTDSDVKKHTGLGAKSKK